MMEHSSAHTPTRLGRYRVIGRLAEGRSTRILAAELDRGLLPRAVALKIPREPDNQAVARELIAEAALIGSLDHPGLVQVFEVDEAAGMPFLVMERVRGVTLEELHEAAATLEQPLPLDVVLTIVVELAATLHFVHETCDDAGRGRGIVHRGVHPTNVMIGHGGWTKLLDFGAATTAETARPLSPRHLNRYSAPELWTDPDCDARADVHALGILLCELAGSAEQAPDAELADILSLAVDPDPRVRYHTARAFQQALEDHAWRMRVQLSPTRVARFLDRLEQLATRALEQRRAGANGEPPAPPAPLAEGSQPSPMPGLDRARRRRPAPISNDGRTRIRLTRRARPISL